MWLSVAFVHPAKAVEQNEMLFGLDTPVVPSVRVGCALVLPREGTI